MEEDFRKLSRDFQALELEWSTVYEKIRKAMGRVVKNRAIIAAAEDTEEAGEPQQPSAVPTTHRFLNSRQREIQQEILKRRAGG